MSGHTPGPWHWDSDPIKDDPFRRARFRVTAPGRTITQGYYPSGDGFAEADTKLIAAAPCLLAALAGLRFRGCFCARESSDEGGHSVNCNRARTALSRAEGKPSASGEVG